MTIVPARLGILSPNGQDECPMPAVKRHLLAAALDVAAARLAIAGSVGQTYIDLARADAQATLARRTIATVSPAGSRPSSHASLLR